MIRFFRLVFLSLSSLAISCAGPSQSNEKKMPVSQVPAGESADCRAVSFSGKTASFDGRDLTVVKNGVETKISILKGETSECKKLAFIENARSESLQLQYLIGERGTSILIKSLMMTVVSIDEGKFIATPFALEETERTNSSTKTYGIHKVSWKNVSGLPVLYRTNVETGKTVVFKP